MSVIGPGQHDTSGGNNNCNGYGLHIKLKTFQFLSLLSELAALSRVHFRVTSIYSTISHNT